MKDRSDQFAGRESVFRAGLWVLAISQVGVGAWALFAPESFYNGFPGLGHHWLPVLGGAYDAHLVTDVGATFLALTVLAALAAIWMELRLVQATLIAWIIYAAPHLWFHVNHLEPYSITDRVANVVALVLQLLIPLGLLALTLRPASRTSPAGAS